MSAEVPRRWVRYAVAAVAVTLYPFILPNAFYLNLAQEVVLLAIGALVGWALGSAGVGAVAGAAAGIPAGIFAVYRRYRGYFS